MHSLKLKFFFLSLFVWMCSATEAQHTIRITGVVLDSIYGSPVDHAVIQRTSDGTAYFSGWDGSFSFFVSPDDSILFRNMAYRQKSVLVKLLDDSSSFMKKKFTVMMVPKVHALDSVVIIQSRPEHTDSIYYLHALQTIQASPFINPITFFYNQFSKKEKEKRLLSALLERDYAKQFFFYRLNNAALYSLTHDSTFTSQQLLRFWHQSAEFVQYASDFDLFSEVKKCYEEFLETGKEEKRE